MIFFIFFKERKQAVPSPEAPGGGKGFLMIGRMTHAPALSLE
jgi:hypothetical protein